MIPFLVFPFLAAAAVWLAGRRDASRDPRLSALVLVLLVVFPLLLLLPKIPVLPVVSSPVGETVGGFPWSRVVMAVWAAGFLVGTVRLVLAWVGLRGWRKRSVFVEMRGNRVELRTLAGLHGPVAAGIFRRVVFVPEDWIRWDEETKRAVLAHELAHHERRDPALRLVAKLAAAVYWWNPLMPWMVRRLALQCEHACDARVIAGGNVAPVDYARLLCRFAGAGYAVGIAMAEVSTLEARVRSLVAPRRRNGFALVLVLGILTVAGAAALALLSGQRKLPVSSGASETELRLSASPFPADGP